MFLDGELILYKGARFENEMFEWINRVVNPIFNEVSTKEELRIIKEMKLVTILCIPNPSTNEEAQKLLNEYDRLRFEWDIFPMLFAHEEDIKKRVGITEEIGIVIYRTFDSPKEIL